MAQCEGSIGFIWVGSRGGAMAARALLKNDRALVKAKALVCQGVVCEAVISGLSCDLGLDLGLDMMMKTKRWMRKMKRKSMKKRRMRPKKWWRISCRTGNDP